MPMQNSLAKDIVTPQSVFVGSLQGRSCCMGLEELFVDPKLILNLYLSGGQSFTIDGVNFSEGANADTGAPRISMINIRRQSKVHFHARDSASGLRKIKMSFPLAWIEREIGELSDFSPALHGFFSMHLSHFAFEPTPDIINLAEQISCPPPSMKGELLTMYRKARGIELMRLSCAAMVASNENVEHKPGLMSARQCERVRHFILSNLSQTLTIEAIARESGASVSSVQRHFKQQFGMTVFEFIRRQRLAVARDALVGRGVTVAEAAWIAGYLSQSSFITAFKKAYGTCPGEIRA